MTRILATLAMGLLTVSLAAPLASAQGASNAPKIAYINSAIIIRESPGRAAITAQFEKEMAPIQAKIKAMRDSNVALQNAYITDEPKLTPEAKASRRKEITDKNAKWQTISDSLEKVAADRGLELERPMMDLLQTVLNDIRQEDGYWMIIDMAVLNNAVVAFDKNMDVTEKVLNRYKIAAAKLPKPSAPGAPASGPVNTSTGVQRVIPPGL
jgi:Skp family chaperone for outer membrane proteins